MIQLEDKLYTSTEVADILGVSLRSVYRYLEEDKITAEVKTATGRHRFSKKNIIDFLYPDGKADVQEQPAPVARPRQEKPAAPVKKKPVVVEEPEEEVEVEMPVQQPKVNQPAVEEAVQEEPIDWLAKFREAAKKYREEAGPEEESPEPTRDTMSMADVVTVSDKPAFTEEPQPEVKTKTELRNFYRSNLGGLKDIAQNIDRGSRNSYLDYAFTMSAGLSLYKPIKPFSLLHVYIKEGDLTFYEKLLGLTPTDESNSQLCLMLSDSPDLYKNREELHGLFVVDRKRLLADVQRYGDSALVAEAESILK